MSSVHYEAAMDMIIAAIKETPGDAVGDAMLAPLYQEDGEDVDLAGLMASLLVVYIQHTGTDGPENGVTGLLKMLDPPTVEVAQQIAEALKVVMDSPGDVVEFLDEL